jgi:hypothetical protein
MVITENQREALKASCQFWREMAQTGKTVALTKFDCRVDPDGAASLADWLQQMLDGAEIVG